MNKSAKIIFFLAIVMGLVSCSTEQKNSIARHHEDEVENKADLKKAALLNIDLGYGYLEKGQVSRSKKKLIHALELAPNLPETHAGLGYFFETVGDNKLAEKHYRKAIFLGKGRAEFHDNYAIYLCSRSKFREADKEFLIAARDYNYPKTAQVYENAGLCALQSKDLNKAENYFKTAVRYDQSQISSMLELSDLSLKNGNSMQAQYYMDRLRKNVKPTPRILWLAIQIAKKNNDKDAIASNALLLKNIFIHSSEYKLYLESQKENNVTKPTV